MTQLLRPVATPVIPQTKLPDAGWPPPPHDPRERELVSRLDDWEVRQFEGEKLRYFLPRGFGHLQFWHPEARVSVLTPSRLTSGLWEAFPIADWKGRAKDLAQLSEMLQHAHHLNLPDGVEHAHDLLVRQLVRAINQRPC